MLRSVLLCALLGAVQLLCGQDLQIEYLTSADSLKTKLINTGTNERIDIFNELAAHYAPIDFDSSIKYSAQAMRLGTVYGYAAAVGMARFNTGNAYYYKLDMKNALISYFLGLRIAEEHYLTNLLASINLQLGNINFFVRRSEKAISYYRKAAVCYSETGQEEALFEAYRAMYMTMFFLGEYPSDSSLLYVTKTLEYAKKTHNRPEEAHALLVKAMILSVRDNPQSLRQKSLLYSDTALRMVTALNDQTRISVINLNLGSYYEEMSYLPGDSVRNLFLSRLHYQQGYVAAIKAGSNYLQVILLNGLSEIDIRQARYEMAKTHIQLCEDRLTDFLRNAQSYTQKDGFSPFDLVFEYFLMRREKTRLYRIKFSLAMAQKDYLKAIGFQQMNYESNEEFRAEQEGRQLELLTAEAEAERTDQKIRMLSQTNELNQLRLSRTRLMFAGAGAVVVIISLFLLLFFQRKRLKAEQMSAAMEQRLLRAQMNPHFLFNSLASIQNYIINEKTDEASLYLSRFSQLVRNVLDNSTEELVSLENEVDAIQNYLELQKVRYAGKFEFNLVVDKQIDPESTFIPPMLAQPFIENSIEHGVKHLGTKGYIDIRFMLDDGLIRFEVEDNGVGREKAGIIEHRHNANHRSMSTSITRERLMTLSRKHKRKIQLDIIDLKKKDGTGCGTRVTFRIPFESNQLK